MALMWRPGRASRGVLSLVALLSVLGFVAVEQMPQQIRKKWYREKLQAARLMDAGIKVIRDHKLAVFGRLDTEHDPNGTGMIGAGLSPITSKEGSLAAKQTTANPNFAAVFVSWYRQAGLQAGDVVAMAYSGSFPAMNLAALVAAEVLKLEPIPIASLSASRWGANIPQLTWLDMERLLFEKGVIHHRSVAASLGGEQDRGGGLPPEGVDQLRRVVLRHGVELIDPPNIEASVDIRMNIYEEYAGNRPIACFVNVGGGLGSVGTLLNKKMFKPGLNRTTPSPGKLRDGVITRFSRQGVPVIHVLNIARLARRYGLPVQPDHYPRVGEGGIFAALEYNLAIAWAVLLGLVVVIFVLLRMDVSYYLLRARHSTTADGRPPP